MDYPGKKGDEPVVIPDTKKSVSLLSVPFKYTEVEALKEPVRKIAEQTKLDKVLALEMIYDFLKNSSEYMSTLRNSVMHAETFEKNVVRFRGMLESLHLEDLAEAAAVIESRHRSFTPAERMQSIDQLSSKIETFKKLCYPH